MASSKKYGLIIPTAKKSVQARKAAMSLSRPSVFGDESSDEDPQKEVNAQIHKEAMKKKIHKQTQIEIQKALEQDSTVYEYDSIYDDMKEQKKKKTSAEFSKADKQRKPKYIANLLKAAEKRAKEQERREERKIQREREKEGNEFEDKPEFVTSAYRQRMIERQKEIEEEKRMDAIEDALDVRKQKDLSGFYRNFLNREICEDTPESEKKTSDDKTEVRPDAAVAEESPVQNEDEDTDLSFSSDESSDEDGRKRRRKVSRGEESTGKDSAGKSSSPSPDRRTPPKKRSDKYSDESNHSRSKDKGHHDYYRKSRRDDCETERRGDKSDSSRYPDKRRKYDRDSSDNQRGQNYRRHSFERDYCYSESRSRNSSDRNRHYSKERRHSRERSPKHRRRNRSRSPRQKSRDQSLPVKPGERRSSGSPVKRSKERSVSKSPSRPKKLSRRSRSGSPSKEKSGSISGDQVVGDEPDNSVVGPKPVEKSKTSSFVKHTDEAKALSARERYLARKAAERAKPIVEPDSD